LPALLSPLENGDVAAFANIDASSSFMGVTYANRAGIWALPIARGSLQGKRTIWAFGIGPWALPAYSAGVITILR
jgi:hypothetical protein